MTAARFAHRPPVDPWARRWPDDMALPPVAYERDRICEMTRRRIVDLYRYGVEVEHLAERFGRDHDTILKVLREAGAIVKGARPKKAVRNAAGLSDDILGAMTDQPMRVAEIAERTGRDCRVVSVRLTGLKGQGLVENVGWGVWRKVAR